MKKIFKTMAVLLACATLGFGFVSCGDPEDDNKNTITNNSTSIGSPAFVQEIPTEGLAARFECTVEDIDYIFYENNTYIRYNYRTHYVNRKGTYSCTDSFNVGSKITVTPVQVVVDLGISASDKRLVTKEELAKIKEEKKIDDYSFNDAEARFTVKEGEIQRFAGSDLLSIEYMNCYKL